MLFRSFVPYYTATWATKVSFLEGRLVAPAGMLYGILLLVVVFVLPGGVIDGIRRVRMRIVRVVPNPSWLPTAQHGQGRAPTNGPDDYGARFRRRTSNPAIAGLGNDRSDRAATHPDC